jgi:hypothetical protein
MTEQASHYLKSEFSVVFLVDHQAKEGRQENSLLFFLSV